MELLRIIDLCFVGHKTIIIDIQTNLCFCLILNFNKI